MNDAFNEDTVQKFMDPTILVDEKIALEHGLTEQEYRWILERMGRIPTITEIGIYSVMWSEHCSYKNSIAVLKTLPREGEALLVGAGDENAGLVDIGDGLAVAFKIESHNHPSAVEPYQGAATGVGGIHRDIFTMGARPICALNSLRFGSLQQSRVRYLFDGVVRGIGDYGNSFGVPTVAGEVYFDPAYEGNPLVNAMSVGIVKTDATASAIAKGPGNKVFIVGSATGRDGIHGATFASEEITEESEQKRPSVQVGDPFTEKLLLEATLEALAADVVVGIQDMGAAGITCSSCEMSAKGGAGMRLNLDHVPVREPNMTAYEIMLSESQERMLLVCVPGKEETLVQIFEKWDLHAVCIGEVTDTGRVQVHYRAELVADVEADHLVLGGGAPIYHREVRQPQYLHTSGNIPELDDLKLGEVQSALMHLLASPNIASKQWVYEQYDTMVRTGTVLGPGPSDAAVVRIKNSNKGLAVTTDCNGRYVYLNPRKGGQIAVAEAARNVVCSGGTPVAITNCLNFGNPYKPEVYWTFREAVAGMSDACRMLNTPVTGGNVSFYNENPDGAVFPTPTIGMLGVVKDIEVHTTQAGFSAAGHLIYQLSPENWSFRGEIEDLGGTEYLSHCCGLICGDAPYMDLFEEHEVQRATLSLIQKGVIQSAHDVSDGGLLVAIAESVLFSDGLGAEIEITPETPLRRDALLFGESQSRIVLTLSQSDIEQVHTILMDHPRVQLTFLGKVQNHSDLSVKVDGQQVVHTTIHEMKQEYFGSIPRSMERTTS